MALFEKKPKKKAAAAPVVQEVAAPVVSAAEVAPEVVPPLPVEVAAAPEVEKVAVVVDVAALNAAFDASQSDTAPRGAVIVVEHEGTKHEAVVRGFAMGCHATLRDGADTPVFVASGTWRRKS